MQRFKQILADTGSVLAAGTRRLLRRRTCTEVFRKEAAPLSGRSQRLAPPPDPCLNLLLKGADACMGPNHDATQLHSNDASAVFLSDVARPSSSRIVLAPVGGWCFVPRFDPTDQMVMRKNICYAILKMDRGRERGTDIRVVVSYEGDPGDFEIEFMKRDGEESAGAEIVNTCEQGAAVLTFRIAAVNIWIVAVPPETCAQYL